MTPLHANIYILKWLDTAKRKKIFSPAVNAEITWLSGYIQARGPLFRHAELLIDGIYKTSTDMLNDNSVNNA